MTIKPITNLRLRDETSDEMIYECPFCHHNSKSKKPRLYINKGTGQYYCHNCQDKGNLLTLASKLGTSIPEIHFPVPDIYTRNREEENNILKIWDSLVPALPSHPYLLKKGVGPHIARQLNDSLVIPIYKIDGSLSSLQYINSDGSKRFHKGGDTSGCFCLIGDIKNRIYVAEGFATSASIYEASGEAVAISFSCGNLEKVVTELQTKYPNVEIIVCGDTDIKGKQTATSVAQKYFINLVFPTFKDEDRQFTDFNDMHMLYGLEEVKMQLTKAIYIQNAKFPFTDYKTFMSTDFGTIEWLVDKMLTTDGLSLLVAKPKVGKSALSRQLAVAVSEGHSFLGRDVKQGHVIYITFEESAGQIKYNFEKMTGSSNLSMSIYASTEKPDDTISWVESEIKRTNPVLVVIDTLFRFATAKQINDYTEITNVLNPILATARKYNTHILCVHHANKIGGDDGNAVLGSTSIFGTVDTLILLSRKNKEITIATEQRYGEAMESTILNLDGNTRTYSLGATTVQSNLERVKTDIVAFLKATGLPLVASEIEDSIECKSKVFDQALRELVSNNSITRFGSGKKGNPYTYTLTTKDVLSDDTNQLSQETE